MSLKLRIDGKTVDTPAVWWDDAANDVRMINQIKIPFQVEVHSCSTYRDTAKAIKEMIIRGAPSIGAAAAYGLAQAVQEFWNQDAFVEHIKSAYNELMAARPTAVDLKNGLDFVKKYDQLNPKAALNRAKIFANRIANEGLKIGQIGKELIVSNMNVLTHCHTGALALVDNGSALAPLIQAWEEGKRFHVYVDETRPRIQGRMTAWELSQYGVDHTVICDSASGFFMSQGKIDLIILGADRVVRNGDIANKIGTYNLAVLANHHNIPFYTAFPTSTFDSSTRTGNDIIIEYRDANEVKQALGYSNTLMKNQIVSLYAEGEEFSNPAFDITPNNLITGYITPYGILSQSQLEKTFINRTSQ
ncbi:MAG: S-methyl-5-thioribose-1-phosphate isomerase [Candidatus Heimdallarchaeota archaeon]|nr:MAG: S-methyl-5-thioribose-1-phosphate isomerase [Candidatus Heimdallarchaeota archaeon]